MNTLHALLAVALFGGPLVGLLLPGARRLTTWVLVGASCGAAGLALGGSGEPAALVIKHTFAAFVGQQIEPKAFEIEHVVAPAWQWPTLCVAWALVWALWAWKTRAATSNRSVVAPLVLAWGGSAWMLALQKAAAPTELALGLAEHYLPPFEFVVWPAILAASLRLGRSAGGIVPFFLHLSVFVALAHLPLAVFGTFATWYELGTYLDVHTIDYIANMFTRTPTELAPGSNEQLAWLVWGPQLIILPALSMLSAGGVGFCAIMFERHTRARAL